MNIKSFQELRKAKHLTREQVATMTNLSLNEVKQSETKLSSIDTDTFFLLAKFYNIDKRLINISTDKNLLILD